MHDKFGQKLYDEFDAIKQEIKAFLNGPDEDDEETNSALKVTDKQREKLQNPKMWTDDLRLYRIATRLWEVIGDDLFEDHNEFRDLISETLKREGIKATAGEKNKILGAVSWREDSAPP